MASTSSSKTTSTTSTKRYQKIKALGEGASGVVWLAKDTAQKGEALVALKKVLAANERKEGINPSGLREIKVLQETSHPSIIKLLDVLTKVDKQRITLVLEVMYTDLEHLIQDRSLFLSASDIKALMKSLLEGVDYLHSQCWMMHRDIKPANCLIDEHGQLKLTDFGLARSFGSPNRQYTPQVQTIWYRAPELLFGAKQYTFAVDMWSVGCTFAEIMLRTPYLPGENDLDQLGKMCAALGTPNEKRWPGVSSLPNYVPFEEVAPPPLSGTFTAADDLALDLLSKMLTYNPAERITAAEALAHDYFNSDPPPSPLSKIPLPQKGFVAQTATLSTSTTRASTLDKRVSKGKKLMF